jgi:hypothetical protein
VPESFIAQAVVTETMRFDEDGVQLYDVRVRTLSGDVDTYAGWTLPDTLKFLTGYFTGTRGEGI